MASLAILATEWEAFPWRGMRSLQQPWEDQVASKHWGQNGVLGRFGDEDKTSPVHRRRPGLSRPPSVDLLIALIAFLVDLRVDIARTRPSTFGNITGNIDEFTGLFARWTDFGRGLDINGIAAFITFESGHSSPPG
jgi:hypothetical protein